MDALPEHLTFDSEMRGPDNIRVYYGGEFVGFVRSHRAKDGWRAVVCNVTLGIFDTRSEGNAAIVEWFPGAGGCGVGGAR